MATSSSLLLQINDDYLTCQICMEQYEAPKVLACLHSFCKRCLESCEKSTHESFLQCPLCRQSTTLGMKGVDGLKNNFVLSNMVSMMEDWRHVHARENVVEDADMCQTCPKNESTMATYQCIECLDQLCADCAAFHSRTKLTRDHEVVSLEDIESGKYKEKIHKQEMSRCKKHKNKSEHYCHECEAVICKDCIIENHQGHSLSPITETLEQIRKEVEVIQHSMESNIKSSQRVFDELIEIEKREKNNSETIKLEIERLSEELIHAIEQKKKELMDEIVESETGQTSQFTFVKDHLDSQIKCMLNCTQLAGYLMQSGTANELLLLKKNMHETKMELIEASKNAEEIFAETTNLYEKISFISGKRYSMEEAKFGNIKKEKNEDILSFIETRIFNNTDETRTQNDKKTAEKSNSTSANDSSPCCSTSSKCEPEEILYVDLPKQTKPQPMPRPRTISRHNKTLSLGDLSTCSDFTRFTIYTDNKLEIDTPQNPETKNSTQSPLKQEKSSNYYPTAVRRKKLSSLTNINETTEIEASRETYHNIDLQKHKTTANQPTYRVAPAPPLAATKPRRKSTNYNTISKFRPYSPKKSPAPLPPTVSSRCGMLKAEVVKVFEIYKQGSKEFCGTPQGVAMTENHIAILDSNEQQVILFNTQGFYNNRFQVHIPNQEKIKPTGIAITASQKIYVLYPSLITVWSVTGVLLSVFGHQHMVDAHGIATDTQERIIVADEGKNDITIFNQHGNYLMNFRSSTEEHLHSPRYICTTSRDEIVVSDVHNNTVKIFDKNCKLLATCKSESDKRLKYPKGITTILPQKGQSEILLVVDQGYNRISAFNLKGKFLYHVLEKSNDSGLKNPQFIAALENKKLVLLQSNSTQSRLYNLRTMMPS